MWNPGKINARISTDTQLAHDAHKTNWYYVKNKTMQVTYYNVWLGHSENDWQPEHARYLV